jgi:hypothetical protein
MPTPNHPNLHHQIKNRLLTLSPRAFELFAGDLLEFIGLHNVSVTRHSGDGGIDAVGSLETSTALISIPTGVQVKRYRANVQRPDIDRFIGALSGRYSQGIFITTAGYTRQAALKASAGIPRVATLNGDQVIALMLQHRLGVSDSNNVAGQIDDEYFRQFEAQVRARSLRVQEQPEAYRVSTEAGRTMAAEDDIISLRALSHALRIDSSVIRRWLEQGKLRPDQSGLNAQGGYFFRRDRIELIRAELLGRPQPATTEAWRQEFIDFARSRNMSKSYKPVLLNAILRLVNRNGEVQIDDLTREFRAFYLARQQAGLPVEFGPPNLTDTSSMSDMRLRQLIIQHPLERFLIKGFFIYYPEEGMVRFAPQLWNELRFRELLDIQHSATEQLEYYYSRPR